MNIVKPSAEILSITPNALQLIERAGRTCYKSEDKITPESALGFVRGLIKRGHESVLEHAQMTILFVVDRGVSHEMVRHRLASYSQESTRYCNYYNKGLEFIAPSKFRDMEEDQPFYEWRSAMHACEAAYLRLIAIDVPPEDARSVLPNSLKTEVVMTANIREWRHVFKMRFKGIAGRPHPDIRFVMRDAWEQAKSLVPVVFDDCGEAP
jgi:thymidylate synthase (FAD)